MTRNSVTLATTLAWILAGAGLAAAETRIAVVNLPSVSDGYRKTRDLENHFEGIRRQANRKREDIRDRIARTQRSLQEEVKPGTEAYRTRLKELATLEAELKWFTEVEGERIESRLAESLREIFDDIRGVVRAIADERGLDLVVASDKLPEDGPSDPGQARQQILWQKVLYWNPRIDITEEVISRLNANYDASKSAGDGGTALPPTDQRK